MSAIVVRCRACTPVSNAELSEWLERRIEALREQPPRPLVRLTRLAQDLSDASIDDGWLLEIELPGEQGADQDDGERRADHDDSFLAAVDELLGEMRILGLAPVVLAPVGDSLQERAALQSAA